MRRSLSEGSVVAAGAPVVGGGLYSYGFGEYRGYGGDGDTSGGADLCAAFAVGNFDADRAAVAGGALSAQTSFGRWGVNTGGNDLQN